MKWTIEIEERDISVENEAPETERGVKNRALEMQEINGSSSLKQGTRS